MAYTLDDVAYNRELHVSTLPDGTDVPHVTAVLAAVGVSTDFEAIADISARTRRGVMSSLARGTAVHADCHAYDDDDLDLADVDPVVRPYVDAWATFRANKRAEPLLRERRVYHPVHCYTGIMDGVFRVGGKTVLLDIKTGDPDDAAAHLQTAAYREALGEFDDGEVEERWAVWLQPGASVPYRIVNYDAPTRLERHTDYLTWLACLAVYREQPGRRKRVS